MTLPGPVHPARAAASCPCADSMRSCGTGWHRQTPSAGAAVPSDRRGCTRAAPPAPAAVPAVRPACSRAPDLLLNSAWPGSPRSAADEYGDVPSAVSSLARIRDRVLFAWAARRDRISIGSPGSFGLARRLLTILFGAWAASRSSRVSAARSCACGSVGTLGLLLQDLLPRSARPGGPAPRPLPEGRAAIPAAELEQGLNRSLRTDKSAITERP